MKNALPAGDTARINREGFTLIEAAISVAILLITIASSVYLMKNIMATKWNAQRFYGQINLAQGKMEELRSQPFDNLTNGTFDNGRGRIEVKDITSDLKEISLTLFWDAGKRPIALYTMRSK